MRLIILGTFITLIGLAVAIPTYTGGKANSNEKNEIDAKPASLIEDADIANDHSNAAERKPRYFGGLGGWGGYGGGYGGYRPWGYGGGYGGYRPWGYGGGYGYQPWGYGGGW